MRDDEAKQGTMRDNYIDLFSCIISSDLEDFGVVKRLERIQIAPVEDVSWDVH